MQLQPEVADPTLLSPLVPEMASYAKPHPKCLRARQNRSVTGQCPYVHALIL